MVVDELWNVSRCRSRSCRPGSTEPWSGTTVRSGPARRSFVTVAEARLLEAKLKLAMGESAVPRERHTVGEVVAGYIADGASRLSTGTLDFYRKGLAALPDVFHNRAVAEVTPLANSARFALQAGPQGPHRLAPMRAPCSS
jgi:hypothetical protein